MMRKNSPILLHVAPIMVLFAILMPTFSLAMDMEVPSCLKVIGSCAKNVKVAITNIPPADPSMIKPVCCPQWKEIIEYDAQCTCKEFGAAINLDLSNTAMFFKACNITSSPDVCTGMSLGPSPQVTPGAEEPTSETMGTSSAANSITWTGLVSGLVTLFAGLMLA